MPQLAAKCDDQLSLSLSSPALRNSQVSIVNKAKKGLEDANSNLQGIQSRTQTIVQEHENATNQLHQFVSSFRTLSDAKQQLSSVEKCRRVADAYTQVVHPLNLHMRDGSLADMDTVASNVEKLIETVQQVRGQNHRRDISTDEETTQKIISLVEKRAIDAIIKARAVFINVLDTEFRQFGWPMKAPVPGKDDKLISRIKAYVNQLNQLQRVSNDGDFIYERTRSKHAHSDNWAVAAILRTPLARFKYHFLENAYHNSASSGTSRFDRPEWAAEFALERIRETTPFLSEIQIDGPHTADVKFAEGFCRVFAEKIAYDCELALRSVKNDSDADSLIAHASGTAKQFDTTLRSGILSLTDRKSDAPLFQSSLHVLSLNESFLTTWASSELRLALTRVNELLQRALGKSRDEAYMDVDDSEDDAKNQGNIEVVTSREGLEQVCLEIANHIGYASQKCRAFESGERISTFLKLTESPLLQTVRARLKRDVEKEDVEDISLAEIQRCGRAALCAHLLSEALEDRAVDALYVSQEKRLGQGFYDDDITRLRTLHSSTCALLSEAVANAFIDAVRSGYGQCTRFGEVWAPDAAIVLTNDLSEPLIEPLTTLEDSLRAVTSAVPCRRSASLIWRPVANKLDYFFFDDVVLQCFVGGTRNATPAASEENGFLTAHHSARMARQVAADVESFVSAFGVVSQNPAQFLPHSAECAQILRIAANQLLLPAAVPDEDAELLQAIEQSGDADADADTDGDSERVEGILESRLNAVHLCARDALELMAISGHRSAIRLT